MFSELRRDSPQSNSSMLFSHQRDAIEVRVAKSAAEKAAEFGIEIVDVRTNAPDLPEEVEQASSNGCALSGSGSRRCSLPKARSRPTSSALRRIAVLGDRGGGLRAVTAIAW